MTVPIDTDKTFSKNATPRSPTLGEHQAFAAMYKRILERKEGRSSRSARPAIQVRAPWRMLDWNVPLPRHEGSRSEREG